MASTVTGDRERKLPFREMLRASPQGQTCETSHVFFTLTEHTQQIDDEAGGAKNFHRSTLKQNGDFGRCDHISRYLGLLS